MTLCPHCMNQTKPGNFCEHCGSSLNWQAAPHQLPAGTILTDGAFRSYEIGAVKGQGGFGITYIAMDLRRKMRVALKEYYPMQCASRAGIQVIPTPGMEQVFAGGQANFLKEAKMLAALPAMDAVVQIMDYFEVNGTAYIAMEYLDGTPLHHLVQANGSIPADQLFIRLPALLQNLHTLHSAGVIHRDISPDNIMWMPNGTLKLLDFGSARHLEDGKSVSIQLKHGFAPVEQYLTKGQGPFTDIYALCATLYYCLTGKVPPHAAERLEVDQLTAPSQLGVVINPEWEEALLWGLTVQPKARPQEVGILLQRMFPKGIPAHRPFRSEAPADLPQPEPDDQTDPAEETASGPAVPVYDPFQHTGKSADHKEKAAATSILTKLRQIPLGMKVLSAVGLLIVILLIILVILLAKPKPEPEAPVLSAPQQALESPREETAEEQEILPEPEPAPEPEPEPAPAPVPDPEPEEPQDLVTENGLTVEIINGNAHITGYDNSAADLEIPEMAFDCPVTTIDTGAFRDADRLETVTLPGSLVWIQEDAFAGCSSLLAIGNTRSEVTVHCDDLFSGCENLILIFLEDGCVWEGEIPNTAALLVENMDSPVGPITDFGISDSGSLYGITDADELVLMKVPAHLTRLDISADAEDFTVVYMLEDALSAAEDLTYISLADEMYYPYAMTDRLLSIPDVICSNDALSCSWTFSCMLADVLNQTYDTDAVQPDIELVRLSMDRAEELTETHDLIRPDGREWSTLLDEAGYDWDLGTHWINWSTTDDDILFDLLLEMMAEIQKDCYDENGELYTTVACGIAEGTEKYHVSWFLIN